MRLFFIFYCLINVVKAENLTVTILADTYQDQSLTHDDLAGKLLLEAHKRIADKVNIRFMPTSMKREWYMLENENNICLYNKAINPQREAIGYFSQRPLIAFPPNRLITLKQTKIPDELPIADAIGKFNLKVGIIGGRTYGQKLDDAIKSSPESFVALEGTYATNRLRKMLLSQRIDAIIEYWPSVVVSTEDKEVLKSYQVHRLSEAIDFSFGYLICSRSDVGIQVIKLFDSVMLKPDYFDTVLGLHKTDMPKEEFIQIEKALMGRYK